MILRRRHGSRPWSVPSVLAIAVALVAILWGLWMLWGVFQRERASAFAQLDASEQTLVHFAQASLRRDLDERHAEVVAALRTGEQDRATDATEDVFLREGGRQVLPRAYKPAPGEDTPVADLYQSLLEPAPVEEADDEAWARRLGLLRKFQLALANEDRDAAARLFRRILAEQARTKLEPGRELAFGLALLDYFSRHADPSPATMGRLLQGGLDLDNLGRIEPLQNQLLDAAEAFSAADFEFLRQRIESLSRRFDVPVAAFQRRAQAPSLILPIPERLPGRSLFANWYLVPESDGRVVGIRVALDGRLAAVESEMRKMGLLDAEDRLRVQQPSQVIPIAELVPQLDSPPARRESLEIERRFRLKSGLLGACAGLAIGLVAVATLAQARKMRFVELKSDFVAAVSHELRTPLASMRLLAETLDKRFGGDPRARDYPRRLVRDIDGMAFLVENLLSFNRLEKGRLEPSLMHVDVVALVDEVLEDGDLWSTKPVVAVVDGAQDVSLRADRELLRLCLLNLFRNASAYHVGAALHLRVTIEVGSAIAIRIQDDGVGIPSEDRTRIFEEFVRGRRAGQTRGSGLGLALCQSIMRLHGGTIRISSTSSAGTTFELRFPNVSKEVKAG